MFRVAFTSTLFAYRNKIEVNKKDLFFSAFFHDIGKFKLKKEIINAPRKLTETEMEYVKTHAEKGAEIFKSFKKISFIISNHHENYDGTGYNKRRGEEIPKESQIIRILDVFDSLTHKRVYKNALSSDLALEIMLDEQKNFNPELFKKFITEREEKIKMKMTKVLSVCLIFLLIFTFNIESTYKVFADESAGSTTDSSATTGSTTDSSATTGSTTDSSVTTGSTTDSSATTGSTTDSSATTGSTTDSSATTGSTTDSSVTTGSTTDSSVTTGSTTDSSVTTGSTTDSSVTTGSTTDSSATTGSTTDSSATTGTSLLKSGGITTFGATDISQFGYIDVYERNEKGDTIRNYKVIQEIDLVNGNYIFPSYIPTLEPQFAIDSDGFKNVDLKKGIEVKLIPLDDTNVNQIDIAYFEGTAAPADIKIMQVREVIPNEEYPIDRTEVNVYNTSSSYFETTEKDKVIPAHHTGFKPTKYNLVLNDGTYLQENIPLEKDFVKINFFDFKNEPLDFIARVEFIYEPNPIQTVEKTVTKSRTNTNYVEVEKEKIVEKIVEVPEVKKEKVFYDINKSNWYHDSVYDVSKRNIDTGYDNNSFRPKELVSEKELISMLYHADGLKIETPFAEWSDPYYKEFGISYFGKDKLLKREEAAHIIDIYVNKYHSDIAIKKEVKIPDLKKIDKKYKEAVASLYKKEIVSGITTTGVFAPKDYLTRAELSAIVSKINSLSFESEGKK